jgi:hypothetical protein
VPSRWALALRVTHKMIDSNGRPGEKEKRGQKDGVECGAWGSAHAGQAAATQPLRAGHITHNRNSSAAVSRGSPGLHSVLCECGKRSSCSATCAFHIHQPVLYAHVQGARPVRHISRASHAVHAPAPALNLHSRAHDLVTRFAAGLMPHTMIGNLLLQQRSKHRETLQQARSKIGEWGFDYTCLPAPLLMAAPPYTAHRVP